SVGSQIPLSTNSGSSSKLLPAQCQKRPDEHFKVGRRPEADLLFEYCTVFQCNLELPSFDLNGIGADLPFSGARVRLPTSEPNRLLSYG
ncbi:MAG: hypothetical protein ACR2PG_18150, partial [Hyphomicrobiaceae bacterium]